MYSNTKCTNEHKNHKFHFQHHVDPAIGVYIIDRYTYYALDFLEKVHQSSTRSMADFVSRDQII